MAVIGWIGLGNMGGPMSVNLVKAGHEVRGFDLNAEAVAAAEAGGVKPAGSNVEAVDGADVVFTMLPKGEHARAAYLGPDGVLAHAGTRPCWWIPPPSTSPPPRHCTTPPLTPASASWTPPSRAA